MTELFKFDEIVKRLSGFLNKTKKLKKVIKSVVIAWTVFTVVAAIWELIPKNEKLPEIDAQELINAVSTENECQTAENEASREEKIQTAEV